MILLQLKYRGKVPRDLKIIAFCHKFGRQRCRAFYFSRPERRGSRVVEERDRSVDRCAAQRETQVEVKLASRLRSCRNGWPSTYVGLDLGLRRSERARRAIILILFLSLPHPERGGFLSPARRCIAKLRPASFDDALLQRPAPFAGASRCSIRTKSATAAMPMPSCASGAQRREERMSASFDDDCRSAVNLVRRWGGAYSFGGVVPSDERRFLINF